MSSNMDELKPIDGPDPSDLTDRTDQAVHEDMSRRSRRAFLWMAAALGGVYGGWRWLVAQERLNGIQWPFRRALEFNEGVWTGLSSRERLSPTFPRSVAREPRPNGRIGLKSEFDPGAFVLELSEERGEPWRVTPAEVMAMPAEDVVTELRCIEGWSQVVHWTGVPLSTFLAHYDDSFDVFDYLYAETPDGEYFVALDREAVRHPQTLLCWAMNGEPLNEVHGAPLRLVVPVKYGIKSLKRVGRIRLSYQRPTDYWYERGYDWYAGL